MSRIVVLAEGQAEETFVRDLIAPHLQQFGVYAQARLATTKHVKVGASFKGGITKYAPVRLDVLHILRDKGLKRVTTLIDYYHLPDDFPGAGDDEPKSARDRAKHIQAAWRADIGEPRFRPYLSLHEYEALLFASPEQISALAPAKIRGKVLEKLNAARDAFESVEDINDGDHTSPAKRIQALIPEYRKPLGGLLIAEAIGLVAMREASPRFDAWLARLEALGEANQ